MELKDKVVLITGAGRGSGRALGRVFLEGGARLAANDVSPVNLDELVQLGARAYTEDVAKKVGAQALLKQVEDELGRLDIVVNHASVDPHAALLEMDEWDWHRVLDVNLTGAFLMVQSAGRIMRENLSGTILNWISLAPSASAHSAAYAASAYGLVAVTRAAAAELAPHGVMVHAVGRGLAAFEDAEPSTPRDLRGAALALCGPTRPGQIVNLEA
jgi:NAD(P)-dependent dehydrogenase (short-subunit alcohol dehydrogenase family)